MTRSGNNDAELTDVWPALKATAVLRVDPPSRADFPIVAGSDEWAKELIAKAERERLLGPLYAAALFGDIELSSTAHEHLVERLQATMLWCLQLEVKLLELRPLFDRVGGVDHLLLKGSAIAHLDEDDPILRSSSDLDLLVRAEHFDRAVEVLERQGAVRPWPQRRPGFDRRFAKSVTMTMPDGVEVDLHRTLCDGVHGVRIPLEELFAEPDHFFLGGQRIEALSRPHRFLHAAYHAVLGSPTPRLLSLRDLAGYMTSPDLPPEVIAPVARRWRGEAVLAMAVRTTLEELPFEAPAWAQWSQGVGITEAESTLVERQRNEGSSFGRAKFDMWRELPGMTDKVAYAHAVLWPSASHLRARGQRRIDPARSLIRRRRWG